MPQTKPTTTHFTAGLNGDRGVRNTYWNYKPWKRNWSDSLPMSNRQCLWSEIGRETIPSRKDHRPKERKASFGLKI
ncbi:hypothetical protein SKAU_G00048540 [Synaphobranchus kaupii]|uniref:Uncharacterized protein n=1 Tax=Synaphobranchus kaupii TaxID=118154 RepID=A0A9Q1G3K0_SYNKA|nr:hypothetical protein SKAU_G00048540 [Synaphobranchus kaupii]